MLTWRGAARCGVAALTSSELTICLHLDSMPIQVLIICIWNACLPASYGSGTGGGDHTHTGCGWGAFGGWRRFVVLPQCAVCDGGAARRCHGRRRRRRRRRKGPTHSAPRLDKIGAHVVDARIKRLSRKIGPFGQRSTVLRLQLQSRARLQPQGHTRCFGHWRLPPGSATPCCLVHGTRCSAYR